jgi:hypothetical protein
VLPCTAKTDFIEKAVEERVFCFAMATPPGFAVDRSILGIATVAVVLAGSVHAYI